MNPNSSALVRLIAVGLLVAACGGDNGGGPSVQRQIEKPSTGSGDNQQGTVAQALTDPLQVLVTENGAPAAGITVTWSTSGTGSGMNPPNSQTNSQGIAQSVWTLNQTAGDQTAQAQLSGATGSPVTFTATALADVPAGFTKQGGDNQTIEANTAASDPLTARVVDQFGNGVGGVAVTWTVTAGDATVNPTSSSTSATGDATTTVTAGPTAGGITITATPPTPLVPVTFTATAVNPTAVTVSVGNVFFQSDRNGTQNPAVDTVRVSSGGQVTWNWVTGTHSVQSTGSPSFTSSSQMTGAGSSYSFTFATPGTYTYNCIVHGNSMTGTVVVLP